jgi:hypothetical protein
VRHKLTGFIAVRLDGRELRFDVDESARDRAMLLAGYYAIVTDVAKTGMATQDVHDNYMRLQKVERDFRAIRKRRLPWRTTPRRSRLRKRVGAATVGESVAKSRGRRAIAPLGA